MPLQLNVDCASGFTVSGPLFNEGSTAVCTRKDMAGEVDDEIWRRNCQENRLIWELATVTS